MAKREVVVGFHVQGAETFQQKATAANKAIGDINQNIRKLDATYGKGSKNTDYLTQRSELLTQKLEAQRSKTEALRRGLDQYSASSNASAAEIERRRRQIANAEIAEADLTRQIRECNTALEASRSSFDEAMDGLEKFEKRAQKVGDSLTRALTIPISGMGVLGLKNAMELEDAMKTVQTLPGVTSGTAQEQAEQLEGYTDAILAASNATHVVAEELAAAQYQAISAGVAAEESVRTVERSAMAAKAGMADVETVINGATSMLNAWGDNAGGLDHVLDALLVAQNEGKTSVGELASNVGQVTGLAPQLGVALDEVLASVAALTKGGVSTSAAFTGLKAVMSGVMKPTAEAREEAARLGLQFDAAALQAKGLTGFLHDVQAATKGDAESLAKLFGSVEALSEIMALSTTQADSYANILYKISAAEGTLDEAFAVRTSSKAEQLAGSLNKLRNSGTELAQNLFPAVEAGADMLGMVADFVGDMDAGTQQALVGILGMTAAAGPAVKALGGLVTAGRTLATVMSGPWGWVTLGVAGMVGLAVAAANTKDEYERFDEAVRNMKIVPAAADMTEMTSGIDAAIEAAKKEKQVTVKAQVAPDFTDIEEYTDDVAKALQAAADDVLKDNKLTWDEYVQFTQLLNGQALSDAKDAKDDASTAPVGAAMVKLIDETNALLREAYTNGGVLTEEHMAQVQANLDKIEEYRREVAAISGGTATQYKTLTDMINSAAKDYRLSEEEFEALRKHLDEDIGKTAEEAVKDASTNALGLKLQAAKDELSQLLNDIEGADGVATQAQIERMRELSAEIEATQAAIDAIRADTNGTAARLAFELATAMADNRLTQAELEKARANLEKAQAEAAAAMEDAASSAVGAELSSALAELDALLAAIEEKGGEASKEQVARMNALLAEIQLLQTEIDALRANADSASAELTRELALAMADHELTQQELEAAQKRLKKAQAEAAAAMEDAATSAVGAELSSALAELDALLVAIEENGGEASQEQVARMNTLLAEIQLLQTEIDTLRANADSASAELTRELALAMADHELTQQELEAAKEQLDKAKEEAEAAMEKAATAAVGTELDKALTELDELMTKIQAAGGDATEDELSRMQALLDEIDALQKRIAELQGRTELLSTWEGDLVEGSEYRATVSGYGTDRAAGAAMGQVIELERQSEAALAAHMEQLEDEYNAQLAKLVEQGAAQQELAALREEYELNLAEARGNAMKAEQTTVELLEALFEGHGQQDSQEDKQAIAEAAQLLSYMARAELVPEDENSQMHWLWDSGFLHTERGKSAFRAATGLNIDDDWNYERYAQRWQLMEPAQRDDLWERSVGSLRAGYAELAEAADLTDSNMAEMYQALKDRGVNLFDYDLSGVDGEFAAFLRMMAVYEHGTGQYDPEQLLSIGKDADAAAAMQAEAEAEARKGSQEVLAGFFEAIRKGMTAGTSDAVQNTGATAENPLENGVFFEDMIPDDIKERARAALMLRRQAGQSIGDMKDGITEALAEGADEVGAAAEEMAEEIEDRGAPDPAAAAMAGLRAAAALAAGLKAGGSGAILAAAEIATEVNRQLAGVSPILPGTGVQGASSSGTLASLAASAVTNVNNSVNVGIQNANFRSPSDMQTLAEKLNAINKMKQAGVGNVRRG